MIAKTPSNIWVAAGDGDLARVRHLIEVESTSPNAPDPFTYTPMHAAASYAQIEVLEYLLSKGGDPNITDSDGDTPLYTVETVDAARWLVEHGAVIQKVNGEGISPIAYLTEDFPDVAQYLETVSPSPPIPSPQNSLAATSPQQTIADVISRAQAEGREPDEDELRAAVGNSLFAGFLAAARESEEGGEVDFEMNLNEEPQADGELGDGRDPKRARRD